MTRQTRCRKGENCPYILKCIESKLRHRERESLLTFMRTSSSLAVVPESLVLVSLAPSLLCSMDNPFVLILHKKPIVVVVVVVNWLLTCACMELFATLLHRWRRRRLTGMCCLLSFSILALLLLRCRRGATKGEQHYSRRCTTVFESHYIVLFALFVRTRLYTVCSTRRRCLVYVFGFFV